MFRRGPIATTLVSSSITRVPALSAGEEAEAGVIPEAATVVPICRDMVFFLVIDYFVHFPSLRVQRHRRYKWIFIHVIRQFFFTGDRYVHRSR